MNRKITIFGLLIVFVFGILLQLFVNKPATVLATNTPVEITAQTETQGEEPKNSFTPTVDSMFEQTEDPLDPGIPEVSTEDVSNWVDKKGFEIVGVLQRFVQPFAIIVMIGCAFMVMIGVFGNSKLMTNGFIGMGIAMTIYVVVLYTPEIMDWFLAWVRT